MSWTLFIQHYLKANWCTDQFSFQFFFTLWDQTNPIQCNKLKNENPSIFGIYDYHVCSVIHLNGFTWIYFIGFHFNVLSVLVSLLLRYLFAFNFYRFWHFNFNMTYKNKKNNVKSNMEASSWLPYWSNGIWWKVWTWPELSFFLFSCRVTFDIDLNCFTYSLEDSLERPGNLLEQ
jgi:hypothetical protein